MKTAILLSLLFVAFVNPNGKPAPKNAITYKLIKKTNEIPGDVDSLEISRMPEHLKALAALYSSVGGSMCNGETCELTTALGLGKQGSAAQKALISKYFTNDKIATLVLKQDCYLRPSGASSFSDFQYLTITSQDSLITVNYNLFCYNRGKGSNTTGPDTYLYTNHQLKKIKRRLWKEVDK